jgi:hypothetical protein
MGKEQKFTEMGNQRQRYLIIFPLTLVINMSKKAWLSLDLTIYCKILLSADLLKVETFLGKHRIFHLLYSVSTQKTLSQNCNCGHPCFL